MRRGTLSWTNPSRSTMVRMVALATMWCNMWNGYYIAISRVSSVRSRSRWLEKENYWQKYVQDRWRFWDRTMQYTGLSIFQRMDIMGKVFFWSMPYGRISQVSTGGSKLDNEQWVIFRSVKECLNGKVGDIGCPREEEIERTKSCFFDECPHYSEWYSWSLCSKSCGGGVHQRHRICKHGDIGDMGCPIGQDKVRVLFRHSFSRWLIFSLNRQFLSPNEL